MLSFPPFPLIFLFVFLPLLKYSRCSIQPEYPYLMYFSSIFSIPSLSLHSHISIYNLIPTIINLSKSHNLLFQFLSNLFLSHLLSYHHRCFFLSFLLCTPCLPFFCSVYPKKYILSLPPFLFPFPFPIPFFSPPSSFSEPHYLGFLHI